MFLISVEDSVSFWLIFRLARPWLLVWIWSELQIFSCLQLKLVVDFNVTYKLFQKLWHLLNDEETLIVNVVVFPKSWEFRFQEVGFGITCELEMGSDYFFCNFLSTFSIKDEIATWIASLISIFNSICFYETSH
jgi:hypothetical protein